MKNKYNELRDFVFKEVDIGLEETEFVKEFSDLRFNGFFFVKTVSTDNSKLKEHLNSIHTGRDIFVGKIFFNAAAEDTKDFIFNFIKNKSLKKLNLSFYQDDDFLSIAPENNSLDNFRKLPLFEIDIEQLKKRLFEISKKGSIYRHWNLSDLLTTKMINDFINNIFDHKECRIFELTDWSGFDEGMYEGFIFINLNKAEITFFAKDEYFD